MQQLFKGGKDHKTRTKDRKDYFVLTDELKKELAAIKPSILLHQDRDATDTGTCVLGAGIIIQVLEPGKKKPTLIRFIHAPFQGNTGSYKALKPCLDYMLEHYPTLHPYWEDGNMD